MKVTLREVRARAQEPVAGYNDVAGRLVGDRLSIHVTRIFLRFGASPTWATLGMLCFGLVGSALIPFGGAWALAGFGLVFLYYICDCVDGEVARYRGIEDLRWGFHDFLFHLYVKTAFYLALGYWAAQSTGEPYFFLAGLCPLIACFLTKFLDAAAVTVTACQILMKTPDERRSMLSRLGEPEVQPVLSGSEVESGSTEKGLGLLRAIVTNFDLSVLLFAIVAFVDLFIDPLTLFSYPMDGKTLMLCGYAIILPLDFLDRMQTYLRQDEFRTRSRRLLAGADRFRWSEEVDDDCKP